MANFSRDSYQIRNTGNIIVSESDDDSEKDSENEDDDEQSWKRRRRAVPAEGASSAAASHGDAFTQSARKFSAERKLNVWTKVLEQRALSENLRSAGVIRPDEFRGVERGSESYAYPSAEQGEGRTGRGNVPLWKMDSQEIHRRLGLKRSRKDRTRRRPKTLQAVDVSAENTEEELVQAIATALGEPKQELIARTVSVLGKEKALEILRMTEDIEEGEGLMTADGSRRRTPGGVFLLLVRNDRDVTKDQLDLVFEEDRKQQSSARRVVARTRRRIKTENLMEDMKLFPTREELVLEQAQKGAKMETESKVGEVEMETKVDKEPGELTDSEEEGEMK